MAGLIPQHFIDELLLHTDIIDVIDTRVPLKKAGKDYKACCPFHDEKTPSFTVSQDKQFYHCFGCEAHGTAISFLMEYDHMSFPEAVTELARDTGMTVPSTGEQRSQPDPGRELITVLEQADHYYRQQLREHPDAQRAVDYLKHRGLSGEIAARFSLGFAPSGWDNLLQALGTDAAARDRLAGAGLVVKKEGGGYYDRFRDRVMFPIHDYRGRIVGFGGRTLDDDRADAQGSASVAGDRKSVAADAQGSASTPQGGINVAGDDAPQKGTLSLRSGAQGGANVAGAGRTGAADVQGRTSTPQGGINAAGDRKSGAAKYLNSPETVLFHKGRELYGLYHARDAIKQTQKVLVVEGYMDVVALAQFGIDPVVGTLGTATTKDHFERLYRYVPEIVFCFDGDEAGRQAAWRALETALPAMQDGRQVSFLFLPEGEDPDSLVRQEGREAFLTRVDAARPLPEFLFDRLTAEVDISRMDGRARLVELARSLIGRLPPGALRSLMIQRLSEISHVKMENLSTILGKGAPARKKSRRSAAATGLQPNSSLMRKAIAWLIQQPQMVVQLEQADRTRLTTVDMPGVELLRSLMDRLNADSGMTTARILEHFRGTDDHSHLEKLAIWQHPMFIHGDAAEFADLLRKIEQASIKMHKEILLAQKELHELSEADREHLKQDGSGGPTDGSSPAK